MKGRLADIHFDRHGDIVVGALEGDIDSSNARELLSALSAGVPAQARGLILDVSALHYLDSAGIEMIFSLADRLRNRRQRLGIVIPAEAPVARVLNISGVESVAAVADSVDAVLSALAG